MRNHWIGILGLAVFAAGCSDTVVAPPAELAPPTSVVAITGTETIDLTWTGSPFSGSDKFKGYNVYADTMSIASVSDSSNAAFLEARKINTTPITANTFKVLFLKGGSALTQGKKYYVHVRTVRDDDRLSVASNEINTSPRPEGTNGGDPALLMFDFSGDTSSRSAFGWERGSGDGFGYATAETNEALIDFFMVEEPNSTDNGSMLLSPAQATFTSGWTTRHKTLFRDLGAGEAAWMTSIAPNPATQMTETVKVVLDHTYALYLHDKYWVKIRVTGFDKNIAVPKTGGGTIALNRIAFKFAFQLINDYGRFKPDPRFGGGLD